MAEIKVFCLHCGQHIQCEETCRGTQINCPSCNHSFLVPQAKKTVVHPPQAPAPAAAPIIAPTTVPAPPPVVVTSPAPPAPKKRIRIKPNYLAEAKEWEGEDVPEGWQKRPNRAPDSGTPFLWNRLKRSWVVPLSIVLVCCGVAVAVLIFIFPASPITKDELEAQVRNEIQETLLKNSETIGTRIDSFNLVHENGNKYSGILIARTGSKTESVDVDVTVNGRKFLWKIQPKTQTDLRTPINNSAELPARTPFYQRLQKHPRANIYGLIQPGESRHLNPTATVLWLAVALGLLSYARSQKDLAAFIGSLAIIFAVFAASTWIWVSIWSFAVIAIVWLVPRDNT